MAVIPRKLMIVVEMAVHLQSSVVTFGCSKGHNKAQNILWYLIFDSIISNNQGVVVRLVSSNPKRLVSRTSLYHILLRPTPTVNRHRRRSKHLFIGSCTITSTEMWIVCQDEVLNAYRWPVHPADANHLLVVVSESPSVLDWMLTIIVATMEKKNMMPTIVLGSMASNILRHVDW